MVVALSLAWVAMASTINTTRLPDRFVLLLGATLNMPATFFALGKVNPGQTFIVVAAHKLSKNWTQRHPIRMFQPLYQGLRRIILRNQVWISASASGVRQNWPYNCSGKTWGNSREYTGALTMRSLAWRQPKKPHRRAVKPNLLHKRH